MKMGGKEDVNTKPLRTKDIQPVAPLPYSCGPGGGVSAWPCPASHDCPASSKQAHALPCSAAAAGRQGRVGVLCLRCLAALGLLFGACSTPAPAPAGRLEAADPASTTWNWLATLPQDLLSALEQGQGRAWKVSLLARLVAQT